MSNDVLLVTYKFAHIVSTSKYRMGTEESTDIKIKLFKWSEAVN